jgi:hypothetical protein
MILRNPNEAAQQDEQGYSFHECFSWPEAYPATTQTGPKNKKGPSPE